MRRSTRTLRSSSLVRVRRARAGSRCGSRTTDGSQRTRRSVRGRASYSSRTPRPRSARSGCGTSAARPTSASSTSSTCATLRWWCSYLTANATTRWNVCGTGTARLRQPARTRPSCSSPGARTCTRSASAAHSSMNCGPRPRSAATSRRARERAPAATSCETRSSLRSTGNASRFARRRRSSRA